ncbi:Rac guanyl-nucleotide exchange factor, putative [Schistosoma mansoni]|uniref:Rac guanyl-nucleotide exchange factor, putative n=1 Tax=Schistosoma mansoni TaxID=6183 RepID=UPI0001A64683|nr:Rac guanyl-nucleotide exchange factor, putative [Schistosoma mansoni]|eukprot:XP_018647101.1 Rac guanyl-nucleotide exchange factor, putative [Schistosoma mansoni]
MFQFFSNALDTQNEELKLLHNKVTELERVNNEVLDFVHKNGRLPEIITDRENLELASDQDDISVYRGSESNHGGEHRQLETVTRRSPNSSVLTGVISKDTEELSRELMSLGLESSKCNHIVDHVQENMDNLVSTDTTAYESQLDFDKKTTCLTPQRGISSPIFEIIDLSDHNASPTNPECSGDDSNKSQNYGQPQYSFLPTISTVTYELRRRELLRANQRIVSNSSYSLNDSIESLTDHISYHQSIPSSLSVQLPSSECQAICIPCNNHSLHYSNSNSNPTMSLTDSVLRYCVSEKSNTDETNPNDYSLSCPCGNPQSCPLSEQKIERLCKNPCIIHGFTILSAVFRGRLIRQLLATPKVHDLIRSVKLQPNQVNSLPENKRINNNVNGKENNKVDLIRNNNNNTSAVDSWNDGHNKNHSLNMVNCKLKANSKNDQLTSTLKSTNVYTGPNNFLNIKTHTDKCLETVIEEKKLSTSSKQVNSSTCETILHTPLINNNTSVQRCFPVKRRILSGKLQNDYSNTSVHINTQNNDVSFWIQDNQSINNTLYSNDNNNEIEHDCKISNSELRATWTLDSKIYPSLTIDTTNLTN